MIQIWLYQILKHAYPIELHIYETLTTPPISFRKGMKLKKQHMMVFYDDEKYQHNFK